MSLPCHVLVIVLATGSVFLASRNTDPVHYPEKCLETAANESNSLERLVTVSVIRERRESHGCACDIADFTVDASLVIPAGTLLEGEKAIEAIYQGAFGRRYAGSHASATFRRDAQLRGEVAMLEGNGL